MQHHHVLKSTSSSIKTFIQVVHQQTLIHSRFPPPLLSSEQDTVLFKMHKQFGMITIHPSRRTECHPQIAQQIPPSDSSVDVSRM